MTVRESQPETVCDSSPVPRRQTSRYPKRVGRMTIRLDIITPLVAIGALIVAGAATPRFISVDNGRAILASTSLVGITAIGATLIMICGSTVSLAASQSASAGAMVFLGALQWGLPTASVVALSVTTLITILQGAAVGYWGANPIVLTIAAGFAVSGASTWLSDGTNVNPTSKEYDPLNSTPFGVPLSVFVLIGVALVAHAVLARTTYGRQMYLVGENRAAARAAGIPIGRVVVAAWAFFGITIGLTAVFIGAFNTTANTTSGGNLSLDAAAAVLVGGTAIAGGRGSAARTLGGALLICAISDLLLLRGYSTGSQVLFKGVLVLIVVLLVHARSTKKEHR